MKIEELKNKKIAILGLGVEGIATAKYFLEHKIPFNVIDEKSKEALANVSSEWEKFLGELEAANIPLILGEPISIDILKQFEVIVRSPGISPLREVMIQAAEAGVEITSSTKLFFANCPCKIIGVTGTKGKGTTSSLIYEMLKKSGFDAYLGGNIGFSPISFLDTLSVQSIVVLEMSSFQLIDLTQSPNISVMLMVTSEHLDYHKDTNEYIEAKRNIVRWQTADDMAILNTDYPATVGSKDIAKGQVAFVSRYQPIETGCFVENNEIILRVAWGPVAPHPAPTASFDNLTAGARAGAPSRATPKEFRVLSIFDVLLPGGHNLENICAAVLAAYKAGVGIDDIRFVLKTFKGLEHRLELVREKDGVRYYDDSFSTVPETAIAAIQAFSAPEILLLGGSSKKSDFTELGKVISETSNIKAIIAIGKEWERIKTMINDQGSRIKIIEGLENMHEFVQKAGEIAQSGDVVLLSPACASFDKFKSYKDRGSQFKDQVNLL